MDTNLPKKKLGNTELEISALSFGAMRIKKLSDAEAESLLNEVLDLGINYIDTSRDYIKSEKRIGRVWDK